MNTEIVDKYQDVLQNIEVAIMTVYRDKPSLSDHSVMNSLEAIIDYYVARIRERAPRNFNLNEVETTIFQNLKIICDWRLGHELSLDMPLTMPVPMDDLILCLKQIRSSVQTWNKRDGRQGYLNFVSRFVE